MHPKPNTTHTRRGTTVLVAIFLAIEFLDELVDGVTGAAWPLIRADLGLSYTEIGLLLSIPTLIANILEPPIGLLGDVWRRYALIALGGLAFTTAMVGYGVSNSFVGLLLAIGLFYPASGTFVELSQCSLMDLKPGQQERSMVIWTVAGGVGQVMGPLLLAGALAVGLTWREPFFVMAGIALVLTTLVWVFAPRSETQQKDGDPRPSMREALNGAWKALKTPRILGWLVLLAGTDLLLEVFVGYLALYMVDVVGQTAELGATALLLWTLSALFGEAILVWLLRHLPGLRVVRWTSWIVLALIPAFLLADSTAAKLVLIALLGLFSAGWYSILRARYYKVLEGRSGTAMAVGSIFGFATAFIPAGIGLLAEHMGLGAALWVVLLAPLGLIVGLRDTGLAWGDDSG